MYKNENEIRAYIEQIRGLCDKVLESLDSGDLDEENLDTTGETVQFEDIQENAKESIALKNITSSLDSNKYPYLIRRKSGEKITVKRNIFKIGKDEEYVDYCISDNATISRSHADILKKTDGYYVKDMGSLNHTFLNGVKLEKEVPVKLENGSLVQFANEVFEWYCD
jgi:pSer/pThr/pTyr-binding forkhead associated (FHA) protein